MKKINLLLCAMILAVGTFAQKRNLLMTTPNNGSQYTVSSISPNGKWACGDMFDGISRGFLWNLCTGEIIELSLTGTESRAGSVTDEGVVAGVFQTTEGTPNNRPLLTYGVWQNGEWTALELTNPENGAFVDRGGNISAISNDGKSVAGIAHSGNCYKPIVWENGKLNIVDDTEGAVYDMSNDGKMLCGWTTHAEKKNRTSVIWTKQEDGSYEKTFIDYDSPYSAGPFSVATGISPNNKYVIACNSVYNTETGDTIRHDLDYFKSGFELFGVTNDGSAYGFIDNGEYPGGAEKYAIKISLDRKITYMRDYLIECGMDMEAYPYIQSLNCMSEDEKTFALSGYDEYFTPCTFIVKLDADVQMAPVSLSSRTLEGFNGNVISWNAPLYTTEDPTGYNIYRNGEKINGETVTLMNYADANLKAGEYAYTVSAVYEGNKESSMSDVLNVTVEEGVINGPAMLRAYNSGLNDVRLLWENPYSNIPACRYYENEDIISGLGGGDLGFESAIVARASELKLYKDAGYKISEISFVPMSAQNIWTVNFYNKGSYDQPLYSEVIPSDNLRYGKVNYYTLKTPFEIPEGTDLVMAISVDVTNYGGYNIMGMTTRKADIGYSDLIRQEGEEKFYSLYESSMNSEYGALEVNVRWAMGMHFTKGGDKNEVKQYVIMANGNEVGTSVENNYRVNNLEDGNYQFDIIAEYTDGAKSEPATAFMDIEADKSLCKTVTPTVTPGDGSASLAWETPAVRDYSEITYSSAEPNGGVLPRKDQDYSYTLGSLYKGNELVPYEGYEITAFRFYPLSDAQFTFRIYENGQEIAKAELAKGEGYINEMWNSVKLDKPVVINRNNEYILAVDCNDCTPDMAPVAMDAAAGYPNVSDLYSLDGGYSFGSIYLDGGKDGNWMIGLEVASIENYDISVDGYNIYLGDEKNNQELVSENTYVVNNLEKGTYTVRVNPVYPNGIGEKESENVTFVIEMSTGIDNIEAGVFDIVRDADQIMINGGNVNAVEMYDINGALAAGSNTNVISIASLNNGIYVMKIHMDGKWVSTKVSIRR